MDPTIIANLSAAVKAFYEASEVQFGPGVNVYCRQDDLTIATAGVSSDVSVEIVRINLVTGEVNVLIPPPPPDQAALSMPQELMGSLRIGINS
jgi:hypothetical protein